MRFFRFIALKSYIILMFIFGSQQAAFAETSQDPLIGEPEAALPRSAHPNISPIGDYGVLTFFGSSFAEVPETRPLADWGRATNVIVEHPELIDFSVFRGLETERLYLSRWSCSATQTLSPCVPNAEASVSPDSLAELTQLARLTDLILELPNQQHSPELYQALNAVLAQTQPTRLNLLLGARADQAIDLCAIEFNSELEVVTVQTQGHIALPDGHIEMAWDNRGTLRTTANEAQTFRQVWHQNPDGIFLTAAFQGAGGLRPIPAVVQARGSGIEILHQTNCEEEE